MRQAVAVENDQKGSFGAYRRYGNEPVTAEVEGFWGLPFSSSTKKGGNTNRGNWGCKKQHSKHGYQKESCAKAQSN